MSSRRKAREFALQLLFQQDVTHYSVEETGREFWKSNPADDATRVFSEFLFTQAEANRELIDSLIVKHALNWRLDRMAKVDRTILRMSVAEFLYADTPKIVVIDEAIEIARKYSGDDSTEFVNGILDAVRAELEGDRPAETSEQQA
jgi:N utilization substance protein B